MAKKVTGYIKLQIPAGKATRHSHLPEEAFQDL